LSDEKPPRCGRCKTPECIGTVIIVDARHDIATWQAPHHKAVTGGKRNSQGKAIMLAIYHEPTVVALREWAINLNAALYGDGAPSHAPGGGEATMESARHLLKVYKGSVGQWVPTKAGDATRLLKRATGTKFNHADYRPAAITVQKGTRLTPAVLTRLEAQLRELNGDTVPDWVDASIAKCMGNSQAMWDNHYNSGASPKDAKITTAVMDAIRQMLLLHAAAGSQFQKNRLPVLPLTMCGDSQPERDIIERAKAAVISDSTSPLVSGHQQGLSPHPTASRAHAQGTRRRPLRAAALVATIANGMYHADTGTSSSDSGDSSDGSDSSDAGSDSGVDEGLACNKCGDMDPEDRLLICDNRRCKAGWHTTCLSPPLPRVPSGSWYCPDCVGRGTGSARGGA
jgi:hypothetical protein